MKKPLSLLLTVCALSSCNSAQEGISSLPDAAGSEATVLSNYDIFEETDTFTNECEISLDHDISINGEGAWIDDNCITISESGVYTVTGEMSDGMIYVKSRELVKIVLDNASITNKSGAAIISDSDKLIIECAEGTENRLKDSKDYTYERSFENEEKHEAAVYAEGGLYFTGEGSLAVTGKKSDAITAAGALFIGNASLAVTADDNGIIGTQSVTIDGTDVAVVSGKDCIKTKNETKGTVTLSGCNLTLTAENDGIQADTLITADGASITITTTGDIEADPELSSKGLKALDMTLSGCTVSVNSTDHAIKADGKADISGGTFTVSSSVGKGISAEGTLTLSGADITVLNAEEGLESKSTLTIDGGNINITSTDDGINTGGDDLTVDHTMNINGGTIIVNAEGDGLDSNGDINITGGTVVVFGPVSEGNSPVDCGDNNNIISVTGGKMLAIGSTGMTKAPAGGYVMSRSLGAQAGDTVTVADGSGNVILSVTAPKSAQGIIFSDGTDAEGYKIFKNGKLSDSADENGFVTGGTVSDGTEISSGDIGGFGGGMRPGGGFGGNRPDGGRNPMGEMPERGEMPEIPEGGAMPDMGTPPEKPEGGMGEIPASEGESI